MELDDVDHHREGQQEGVHREGQQEVLKSEHLDLDLDLDLDREH
jgi:inner membrane protein involved in colicin E2 resistance